QPAPASSRSSSQRRQTISCSCRPPSHWSIPAQRIGSSRSAQSVGTNTVPGTPNSSMIGRARSSTERYASSNVTAKVRPAGGAVIAWADAWWRVYGDDRTLLVTACRDHDGRLVAVLPLYLSTRRPVRTLRFLGHGPADQLGPVCAAEDRIAVAEALKRLLTAELSAWDVFLAERLAPSEGWTGALGGPCRHRRESPTLLIGGRSWEEFLASRSKNFREQVRRRDRKLRREHEVELRLTGSA